jgi:hypothetical protein
VEGKEEGEEGVFKGNSRSLRCQKGKEGGKEGPVLNRSLYRSAS